MPLDEPPSIHLRFTDSVLVSRREWVDGEPRDIPEAEWNARVRIAKLEKALRFYAGRLRDDKNGYEFDEEPTHIRGGVARQALKGSN